MKPLFYPIALALVLAIFFPGPSQASPAFPVDDVWRLVELDGKAANAGEGISLMIGDDGTASGHAGCNRFTSRAILEGSTLSFETVAMTRMMCAEPQMQQERRFQETLAEVARWDMAGRALIFLDREGNERLRFEPLLTEIRFELALPAGTQVETATINYNCEDRQLQVDYINAGPVSLAILNMADETVVAAAVVSASGARYAGGEYVWWTRGAREASLALARDGDDTPEWHCRAE
ncbi:META domain-containing protein [Stappia stellulata]|uniref:META domain-containing protein n=1 Tax=Stappia stellulata TaxID=71235 RepID=UPI00040FA5B8|nr:META domain-containing protein [Stappia stellulata]